nr:ATP-binding protein [uncultured Carboxylicivirga sp.]
MARADLLLNLIKHGISDNKSMFRKVAEAIIAEERKKNHVVLAKDLEEVLSSTENRQTFNKPSILEGRIESFVTEVVPRKTFTDIILPKDVKIICEEIIKEQFRVDLLRSYNLEPRNRILLIGPPGNGKTSLAEVIANSLMIPLYVVRYESIIGTYLGETASRLNKLFEYVRTRQCVLFFDEFETLGKERGDTHETGEIKRVVSSLLLQIDRLPSHVFVIGATNHPELLDRAVWRRFQARVNLPQPTRERIEEWIVGFESRYSMQFGYSPLTLAKRLYGANYSEIEDFALTILRKYILNKPDQILKEIVKQELSLWDTRTEKVVT